MVRLKTNVGEGVAARKRLAPLRCLSRRGLRPCSAVLASAARKRAKALFRLKAPALAPLLDDAQGSAAPPNACAAPFSYWVG